MWLSRSTKSSQISPGVYPSRGGYDAASRSLPDRHLLHPLVFDLGVLVPRKVQRKEQPVLIIDECGVNLLPNLRGLAADLRAEINVFDRFSVLVLAFVRNAVGLGLPYPGAAQFDLAEVQVKGVANLFDLRE